MKQLFVWLVLLLGFNQVIGRHPENDKRLFKNALHFVNDCIQACQHADKLHHTMEYDYRDSKGKQVFFKYDAEKTDNNEINFNLEFNKEGEKIEWNYVYPLNKQLKEKEEDNKVAKQREVPTEIENQLQELLME